MEKWGGWAGNGSRGNTSQSLAVVSSKIVSAIEREKKTQTRKGVGTSSHAGAKPINAFVRARKRLLLPQC